MVSVIHRLLCGARLNTFLVLFIFAECVNFSHRVARTEFGRLRHCLARPYKMKLSIVAFLPVMSATQHSQFMNVA